MHRVQLASSSHVAQSCTVHQYFLCLLLERTGDGHQNSDRTYSFLLSPRRPRSGNSGGAQSPSHRHPFLSSPPLAAAREATRSPHGPLGRQRQGFFRRIRPRELAPGGGMTRGGHGGSAAKRSGARVRGWMGGRQAHQWPEGVEAHSGAAAAGGGAGGSASGHGWRQHLRAPDPVPLRVDLAPPRPDLRAPSAGTTWSGR